VTAIIVFVEYFNVENEFISYTNLTIYLNTHFFIFEMNKKHSRFFFPTKEEMFTQPFDFELMNPYHKLNDIQGIVHFNYHSMNDIIGNINSSFSRLQ